MHTPFFYFQSRFSISHKSQKYFLKSRFSINHKSQKISWIIHNFLLSNITLLITIYRSIKAVTFTQFTICSVIYLAHGMSSFFSWDQCEIEMIKFIVNTNSWEREKHFPQTGPSPKRGPFHIPDRPVPAQGMMLSGKQSPTSWLTFVSLFISFSKEIIL